MKNENTSLYRELELTLTSKFDLFKSDIVVENRKISGDIVNRVSENLSLVKNDISNQTKLNIDDLSIKLNEKIEKKTKLIIILVSSSIFISICTIVAQLI